MNCLADIRHGLASLHSDHDASGQHRPTVEDIFAPEQHANALDPNTPVVVGARGAGKSFWAGVLEHDDTREVASLAYPHLGLNRLVVRPGYTGLPSDAGVSPATLGGRVPEGQEDEKGFVFWQAVILQAAKSILTNKSPPSIRELMKQYEDPEEFQIELRALDDKLSKSNRVLLVTFDALDTLSKDWKRSALLLDALFEVVWTLRARRALRAKLFIRPEQLADESLRFVELPKLRSAKVELAWNQVDLYGLLFCRLAEGAGEACADAFKSLASSIGAPAPADLPRNRKEWALTYDESLQKKAMAKLAGTHMGRSNKKGGTYDWPYKHLGDANGEVTPRSFVKLFVEAARFDRTDSETVISPDGIRHGLREASKVRVDQLVIEYQWVKRALAPLAGLTVPCEVSEIYGRWLESETIKTILRAAADEATGFLPPFPARSKGDHMELLATAMARIGLLSYRSDGRVDIPDLFRVAALMLKKGGTTPVKKR